MNETTLAAAHAKQDAHLLDTYGSPPVMFVRGKGTVLTDTTGQEYLDFLSGLAVTSLGHGHPAVTAAVSAQMRTLVHTSNLFLTEPMLDLADDLAWIAGWDDGKVFFAQCGATANEAALKLARRHGLAQSPDKIRVVTLSGSFHGRTMVTLEATGQPEKHERFLPMAGWVDTVPYDDPAALEAAVTDQTCAVLLECVQGEGGVRPLSPEMLAAARRACDEHGALLIIDEVQTGMGRTGTWFAFQQTAVEPDVITVAKALANGLPIGACIARGQATKAFQPGDHATTFGGNPVTAAAARAVIRTITEEDLLTNVTAREAQLRGLVGTLDPALGVAGVRGRGLLLGLDLEAPTAKAVEIACRERFLVVGAIGDHTIRLAPPLNVSDVEVRTAITILGDALAAVAAVTPERA